MNRPPPRDSPNGRVQDPTVLYAQLTRGVSQSAWGGRNEVFSPTQSGWSDRRSLSRFPSRPQGPLFARPINLARRSTGTAG